MSLYFVITLISSLHLLRYLPAQLAARAQLALQQHHLQHIAYQEACGEDDDEEQHVVKER